MGTETPISWTDHTFNPWEGCHRVSPACDNCYAAARDKLYNQGAHWDTGRYLFHDRAEYWRQLHQWNAAAEQTGRPQSVFTLSLGDVFDADDKLTAARLALFARIERYPWLTFLLTTKRPENAEALLPASWLRKMPPNVWCITTVESDEYRWRIVAAARLPWPVGISCEPLLSALDLDPFIARRQIQWIIAGGESGQHARITQLDWVRSLRDQAAHAEIPFHFKQWGEWAPEGQQAKEGSRPHCARQMIGRQHYRRRGVRANGYRIDGTPHRAIPTWHTPAAPPAQADLFAIHPYSR